jgi:hypothetical protein
MPMPPWMNHGPPGQGPPPPGEYTSTSLRSMGVGLTMRRIRVGEPALVERVWRYGSMKSGCDGELRGEMPDGVDAMTGGVGHVRRLRR